MSRGEMTDDVGQAKRRRISTLLTPVPESLKERMARAREGRDQRRARITSTHKTYFEILSTSYGLPIDVVEDFVLDSPETLAMLESFCAYDGIRSLIFVYQEGDQLNPLIAGRTLTGKANVPIKRVFGTNGTDMIIDGSCTYFVKLRDLEMTSRSTPDEVYFGTLQVTKEDAGSLLKGITLVLDKIFKDTLDVNERFGKLPDTPENRDRPEKRLLEQFSAFVTFMKSTVKNVANQTKLVHDPNVTLLKRSMGYDEVFAISKNQAKVEKIENLVTLWYKQLEENLAETAQIRREADDVGPLIEVDQWRGQASKFMSIQEQTKEPHVVLAIQILTLANSKLTKVWKEIKLRISEAANEAQDNLKYMTALEKYCLPLYTTSPTILMETIPHLLNSIRLINSVSRYYNTAERMTSLFIKITNQMVSGCRKFITDNGNRKLWEISHSQLKENFKTCIKVYEVYQVQFRRVREEMMSNPGEKQFEFSEMYIFGKFDAFCKRLQKLLGVVEDADSFAALGRSSIEGTDALLKKFEIDYKNFKSKVYDYLDHRKQEFEYDYEDFRKNIYLFETSLNAFMDESMAKHVSTVEAVKLLIRFDKLNLTCLNVKRKFGMVLKLYEKELEYVIHVFETNKDDPSLPRGMPPVAGRIAWARQLFYRCAAPLAYFESYPEILQLPLGIRVVRMYNYIGKALVQFELSYHELWVQNVDNVKNGLLAPLLVIHPESREVLVNFDQFIPQTIQETSTLAKMELEVPELAKLLVFRQHKLHKTYTDLKVMINEIENLKNKVPPSFTSLMAIPIRQLDTALIPGIRSMTWLSMSLDKFFGDVQFQMDVLGQILKNMHDIKSARIDETLTKIENTILVTLPDEPLPLDKLIEFVQKRCDVAANELENRTHKVEEAVNELISMFLTEANIPIVVVHGVPIWTFSSQTRRDQSESGLHERLTEYELFLEHIHEECRDVFSQFRSKHFECMVQCVRMSLEALRKRIQMANLVGTKQAHGKKKFNAKKEKEIAATIPLFFTNIVLVLPNLTCQPNIDDLQQGVNKISQFILEVCKKVTQWGSGRVQRKASVEIVESAQIGGRGAKQNNFYKMVVDHKDVSKVIMMLSSSITEIRTDVLETVNMYDAYQFLWNDVREDKIKAFVARDPIMVEYKEEIVFYEGLEQEIRSFPPTHRVGAIELSTEQIKLALAVEAKAWKIQMGKHLNYKFRQKMERIAEFVNDTTKRLQRPVKSLEDVSFAMQCLEDVREEHLDIDMSMGPIEEAYALLQKFNLPVAREELEQVDTLRFGYGKLCEQAALVQDQLIKLQPKFRRVLLKSVGTYQVDVADFAKRYEEHGPMEEGIPAREASDRLAVFSAQIDDLSTKLVNYSEGEELFGMKVNDYPVIHKVKKEIALLQRLYGLYNQVMDSIDGYGDILWSDVDIDKLNNELTDFQNRCKKLPKALKDWQAYKDLKKKIDDFSETCPLLELMTNKAMKNRHWKRLEALTDCRFDVTSESFQLRGIIDAPLLKYREEVEDICISAVKEKDIEQKLKQVIADWSVSTLTFSSFKTRGELLLKSSDISEVISMLEDSLMIMGSLLSNRYNAPFKNDIQLWVELLSNTNDILTDWLTVQNLWIYLEAVFVGGDIAKQLPQEAKRFANIDKSWVKIMARAHELSNVIQCCVSDDTMSQLLPHLMEQLEQCQKSLTGYLESKRLIFPRFFFISDPSLLEILGQASDSHSIQPHLLGVFENVAAVEFAEKEYDRVIAFVSREKERIPMDKEVMARGNVEVWLGDILEEQQRSLNNVIHQGYDLVILPGFNLLEFLVTSSAQVGLLGLQFLWTRDAEIALKLAKTERKIMNSTNNRFLEILNNLIHQTTHDLTKFQRIKFETLITIHVHQRDIFDDLCRSNVKSITDFDWQKQARFYYPEEGNQCLVKITDVTFIYQNEYLGCTDRLVITPLTDRCYITLAQAVAMNQGGAPAGPAGTGKTETVKDMGKALGKYVVVFNCSDQMDFRGLGRIYKGLAQSGSWGCFDEFNRINLPVLSVAAQQIHIVLAAKKEKKTHFIFSDGDVVELNPEFGLFITMNPGYAGRQELPENMKVLFRTVSMMVPDRQIIKRVKLASCGFVENVILAQKFFVLYKLCEEQLSKQVHYDFGLRNILSVLRTLGAEKRSRPTETETTIVMRVLRDMNLSKLVDEDEPLFVSLISDLFPGIQLDSGSYPELQVAIANQVAYVGLVNHPPWNLKLVQLYEQQRVRHGIMLLGPSGAGKTCCIDVLLRSLTEIGLPHREMRMNPKAITASQMFGRLDVATNDWTDGIFSTLWRRSLKAKPGEHIWIVLDGPVDAVWIENLNSVLDDNKTLTLANGDRIVMAATCKLCFEPDNIDNASPATVSRCGMVFVSSSYLDWKPILKAWLKTRTVEEADILEELYNRVFYDLHTFMRNNLNPKMKLLECNYIRQTMDLLEGLIPDKDQVPNVTRPLLEKIFIFSLMWSCGALLELDDRYKMEQFLKKHPSKMDLPRARGEQTIFEFIMDKTGKWEHWNNRIQEYVYPDDSVPEYTDILIPNVDNVRTTFLMDTICMQSKGTLLIGEPGTAKTVMIKGYMSSYDPEVHISKVCNFSSATVPLMFQRTIEGYLDKRMGSTYGPPGGRKMTIFIDDINMPVINEWGDQIANELARQAMVMKGFYNLERPGDFTHIVDVQYVAAMIHPGGGRNDIPPRLKRQFCIFNCTLPSNASIDKIFGIIGCGYFCSTRFIPAIVNFIGKLVPATRILWQQTKIKLLPTPAKFHYIFNLRDLSRIWQGILRISGNECRDISTLLGLWNHECVRVIADRFVNFEDKAWFNDALRRVVVQTVGEEFADMMPEEPYFVDFLREVEEPDFADISDDLEPVIPNIYELVQNLDVVKEKLEAYLLQYNEATRGGGMDLVFFRDCMIHLIKVSRVIKIPMGHALLVGVGGSGKQSLTKLASFIADYKLYQIILTRTYNVSNLIDDLKHLYRVAGKMGQGISFIFTDNEIKEESFLEYMNNVLSGGEPTTLFQKDERDEIFNELTSVMKREFPRRLPNADDLNDYFIARCKANLHVVLCFSPVGEKFRIRALKFPGLISGCTMDWFSKWPTDALVAVATYFLMPFEIVTTPEMKLSLIDCMAFAHEYVEETCGLYFQRFRRANFVTPKSYLSFINMYKMIYVEKHSLIGDLAYRMTTGLTKLLEATESVGLLSVELVVKEKELAIASLKADKVLEEVTRSAEAATTVKNEVQKVKDKAQKIVDGIAIEKAYAEEKLEAAKPAMKAAEDALLTIKSADIATVRKLGKPPHLIMRIMDIVLMLFQKHLDPTQPDPDRVCPKPSWSESMKLMSGSGFLFQLQNFPKDTINEETLELMAPYMEMPDYNFETALKVCGQVAGLLAWTLAMVAFYGINKEVLPLKSNLIVQEARLTSALGELNEAQMQLDEKQKELDIVQAVYDAAMREKQALLDDAENCRFKMSTASSLINGLSGERVRWTEQSKLFKAMVDKLCGDVLILCGFISYTGGFNSEFRINLLKTWQNELSKKHVYYTADMNVVPTLTDPATIGEWNLQGLPTDDLSIQNGIIVTKALRYPLLIDPQGQGKLWVIQREKDNELMITSLNHKMFRMHIEDALSLGRPLLIEDVGEYLDPALDNVLEKNFIKSGRMWRVKLGDKECDLMKGFTLTITTKLPNPKYSPEICAKSSIIDFTVTMKGLEDQLLGRVIATEKPELETEKKKLLETVTSNKRRMQDLEDNLLYKLTSTQGSLVEDESLLIVLAVTKETAAEVKERLIIAAETEIKINLSREEFRPVAARGSTLYFLICEMTMVNYMYQTSLKQFLQIFDWSMAKSEKSPIAAKRIGIILEFLTFEVFKYASRGLYEQDKFLFVIQLALKIDIAKGIVRHEEFQNFLKGGAALDLNSVTPKPCRWITDMTWLNLVELSKLPQFREIVSQITRGERIWKAWFDKDAPEDEVMPEGYSTSLDTFRKLLLIRAWCPDRTSAQARKYVADSLGRRFAEPVILSYEDTFAESEPRTPLLGLLSMGSDPTQQIQDLAKKYNVECEPISMGQGQEIHARRLCGQCMAGGGWVLLQNCHLGLAFLDELLELLTAVEWIHEDFRVWITTEPHPLFPISLLQCSIKFTNQPPQGMRAGLTRTYANLTQEQFDYTEAYQWKPMLYAVSFLHSCIQERRKYGPQGWNIPYEFNTADYTASVQFVMNHLDDMDPKKGVSWVTVRYMLGEVQYGGRVTDDFDKRLLITYCKVWFGEFIFADNFTYYKEYKIPKGMNPADYLHAIEQLPDVDSPLVFGLHTNADINYQTTTARNILDMILSIQPKESAGGEGESRESVAYRMADDMLDKMPGNYVQHEVQARLEKMGRTNPLNIILKQEVDRMQRVISLVRSTLSDLKLAVDGTIIMSENLKDALDKIYDARVPGIWTKVSWSSASIGFWFTEFLERNEQFHRWMFVNRPICFWMTGFFNAQGFLTSMRQEVARMHKGWALDTVTLHTEVSRNFKEEISNAPPEGVLVYGLFLDGAAWDRKLSRLIEQTPKVLSVPLPVIHMFAINSLAPKDPKLYLCPVYKKPRRTDETFVTPTWLKTTQPPEHWILRSVALLCDTK